ncbi:unnamed protein product [Lupinus luteus]|uniref:Protein EARLY FLOWERING 4 domain-containing protein n=1 Tax=Lupinus luteus TaxID=3873 RepID=A0AAV1WA91_LUPLU
MVTSPLSSKKNLVSASLVASFNATITMILFTLRWIAQTYHSCFVQVQNILGQNRVFINETNWNYEPKVSDNLSKNVGLIREFNNTVRRVVDLIPTDPLIEEVPTAELLICSDLLAQMSSFLFNWMHDSHEKNEIE